MSPAAQQPETGKPQSYGIPQPRDRLLTLATGREPTLLCLPGTMCSPAVFAGLAATGHRVVAAPWLEWPGPHDMVALGDRVAALCGGGEVLVGHSTGGPIALAAALRARQGTLAGLVLCDTGANTAGHGDVDSIIERVTTGWGPPLWAAVAARSVHLPLPADRLAELTGYPRRLAAAHVVAALRSQRDTDLAPALHRLAGLPALVVHGRHDAARPVAHAVALADALPGATLTVLDCGHTPPVELPEIFAATVRDWLYSTDGRGGGIVRGDPPSK